MFNYKSIRGYFYFQLDKNYPGWDKYSYYWPHMSIHGNKQGYP